MQAAKLNWTREGPSTKLKILIMLSALQHLSKKLFVLLFYFVKWLQTMTVCTLFFFSIMQKKINL